MSTRHQQPSATESGQPLHCRDIVTPPSIDISSTLLKDTSSVRPLLTLRLPRRKHPVPVTPQPPQSTNSSLPGSLPINPRSSPPMTMHLGCQHEHLTSLTAMCCASRPNALTPPPLPPPSCNLSFRPHTKPPHPKATLAPDRHCTNTWARTQCHAALLTDSTHSRIYLAKAK